MRVERVMTKDVKSCSPADFLNRAAQLMWEHDCGVLPVVDETGKVVGLITDRDICMAAYTQGKRLEEMPVTGSMSREVWNCHPADSVGEAEERMRLNQVRRLPVVEEDGSLVGILSLNDIAREAARQRGNAQKRVTDTEVGETLAAICRKNLPRQVAIA